MRESSPWWFLPAPIAAGALVAALVTIFQPTLYRSETALSARRGGVPASRGELKRLARIARSDAVSAAARSSLGLAASPDERSSVAVDARSAVLRIRYEDGDAQRGRRIAQEVALAFAQTVHERFRRGRFKQHN